MIRSVFKRFIWFLERNKLNFVSYNDSKVMHFARHGRYDKIIKEQIRYQHLLYRNKKQESLLSLCISSGLNELFTYLVNKFPTTLSEKSGEDQNPLLIQSVIEGNLIIFNFLLHKKTDLHKTNKHGLNILNYTAKDPAFTKIILKHHFDYSLMSDSLKKSIIVAHAQPHMDEKNLMKIIKDGITKDMTTREICFIAKFLLQTYKWVACETIMQMETFNKDLLLKEEELLNTNKEGYLNGKLVIKPFNYSEKFKLHGYKITNFHKILGVLNKDNARLLYENIMRKPYSFIHNVYEINYDMINRIYFIKTHFKMDENLIKPLFGTVDKFEVLEGQEKRFAELLSHYSNKRIVQIVCCEMTSIELRDTLYMHESLKKYCKTHKADINLFLPDKPKRLREIHDKLQFHLSKIGKDNIPINLEMPLFILKMHNKSFNGYTIRIPNNNSELVITGQTLAICVGNNFYANEMSRGRVAIILLYKKNKVEYCIEYDIRLNQINQSKTYYNTEMNKPLKEALHSFIVSHISFT